MQIGVLSLFPDWVQTIADIGIVRRAVERKLLSLHCWNPRDYASDRHGTVDDRSYGGGPGMVMKVEPLEQALGQAQKVLPKAKVVYLSPQGRRFDQAYAQALSQREQVILLTGRYEGVDERFIDACVDEELSIGDYVLSGGEPATMVVIDAITRLLPGALGDEQSAEQDSFTDGLLDHPHYTRPEVWRDRDVPAVLRSGDHEAIRLWRLQQSLGRTKIRRPDLLSDRRLSQEEQELLEAFMVQQDQD